MSNEPLAREPKPTQRVRARSQRPLLRCFVAPTVRLGKGLYSLEGRRLQAACRACAQDRISEHEAKVRRVAKELLQPPHEIRRARFEQMMQED
jgi:hypothetical protein